MRIIKSDYMELYICNVHMYILIDLLLSAHSEMISSSDLVNSHIKLCTYRITSKYINETDCFPVTISDIQA